MDYSKIASHFQILKTEEANLVYQIELLKLEQSKLEAVVEKKRKYGNLLSYIHQNLFLKASEGQSSVALFLNSSDFGIEGEPIHRIHENITYQLQEVGLKNIYIDTMKQYIEKNLHIPNLEAVNHDTVLILQLSNCTT